MNKYFIAIFIIFFSIFENYSLQPTFEPIVYLSFNIKKNEEQNKIKITQQIIDYDYYENNLTSYNNYLNKHINYNAKKEENMFRRMEILFFGSLTIVSFSGWFAFSIFNVLIYNDPFGVIRREQFLTLYLGSSVISLSVSVSDLLVNLKKKNKYVEFY